MSSIINDTHADTAPIAKHSVRPAIPRIIRRLAVPIILAWIAIIALLNVIVPQLDKVGQMRSVSMSPDDAQSVIATKHVGEVFGEYKSNSSVMIVRRTCPGSVERSANRGGGTKQRRQGRLRPGLPRR
jgi:putative drug exporter of the RND superfamily